MAAFPARFGPRRGAEGGARYVERSLAMTSFHVLTTLGPARLHLWRDRAEGAAGALSYDVEPHGVDDDGLLLFPAQLNHQLHEPAHALLHDGKWGKREVSAQARALPRVAQYRFPEDVWPVEGTTRVLQARPFDRERERVRVHVVTRGVDESLFVWLPGQGGGRGAA